MVDSLLIPRLVWTSIFLLLGSAGPFAGTLTIPNVTIYPGDVILGSQLVDEPSGDAGVGTWMSRSELVGRVSRKTLIKEKPIAYGSVEDAKTFKVGSQVQLIYQDEGLTIVSAGMALQSGSTGDSVRVRNTQSGQVVVGQVTANGAIKVGSQ